MSQHLDSMPSRSEFSTFKFENRINSLSDLVALIKTYSTGDDIFLSVGSDVASALSETTTTYVGIAVIHKASSNNCYYHVFNNQAMAYGNLQLSTGNVNIINDLNSKITNLPNTLNSSYNVLVDAVQISQTETVYTLYGSRKFSDYITLYITPMVEGYFRPGCVIPRSTFVGNGNGTSFTYPSGGIDVEVVIKYLSDTQVKMKYNASAARDVRVYLGALKLEN